MTETAVGAAVRPRSAALALLIALLSVLQCAMPAWANMGRPWRDARVSAEPQGFDTVRIGSESLHIDLSDLSDESAEAKVYVDYWLDNPGPAIRLRPVFATGASDVSQFKATLDGRAMAARPLDLPALPRSWQPPQTTPSLSGEQPLSYEVLTPSSLALDFVLPPGRHVLRVSYRADAMQRKGHGPTLLYQFAYVLAPARSWAGFANLHLTVSVPEGWRIGTSLSLNDEDVQHADTSRDTYHGRYPGLPADAIEITTQAPPGIVYRVLTVATVLCSIAVVFGGGVVCGWIGGAIARRLRRDGKRRRYRVWPYALDTGLAWGVATACAGLAMIYGPDCFLPAGQAYRYGYGQALGSLAICGLSLFLIGIGWLVTRMTAMRHLRDTGADAA
ncbi:MAG: hypothetical protein JF591_09035 [Lysobacter sp.]|nr:hypothetical protein [Lysobacter sp.]